MDLTDKQLIIWKELGSELSAPPDICHQAFTFYSHYRSQQDWPIEKASMVWRVAFFLAEKAQIIYDNQGHRLKGIALSANIILRDHPRHEEFLYHLKQMIRTVPVPAQSEHLQEQVAYFSRYLSFSLAFLNKLKSTLKRIRISQKSETTVEYQQHLLRYLWLLFIDSKAQRQIGTDIIESTCLMSCVFIYFLIEKYKEEGIFSIYFQQQNQGCTLSNQQEQLLPFMQAYFHIKDTYSYQKNYTYFFKYLQDLSRNIENKRPFSSNNIQKNIYIIQKLYSKKLNDNILDESTFLRVNTTASNLPIRMTPFGRKPLLAPRNMPALSHKILTYELSEQQNKSQLSNRTKEEKGCFNILNKLKNQPTPKTLLIRATPMSEAMQMYNWLYQKKHRYPLHPQDIPVIQQMITICSKNQSQRHEIGYSSVELVGGLWGEIQQRCQLDPIPSIPLLLISSHLTVHILNAPLNDISVAMLNLSVSQLQVWQSLDVLLNFDKNMPLGLRLHLLSIETSFINTRLWRSRQLVQVIAEEFEHSQHRLFKRLMHQSAFQIHFLCRKLNLQEIIEDLSYMIFQQALKSEENLLFERSLEHLILCSIYAATKVNELVIKFNQILAVCRQVLGLSSANYQQLIDRVKIGEKKDNIIVFYNMIFVPTLKSYLKLLRTSSLSSQSLNIPKVREMISKQSSNLAKTAHLASPQMATYFAYNQSPILRPRLKQMSSNTIRREQQYSLQDISTKFGKFNANNALKQTRKIKH